MYPFIVISDSLAIPTYLLTISLTYCLCILWVFIRAQKHPEINPTVALDVCLSIMIGGLLGARSFHVLYENYEYYSQYPMDVFKLWQGGFVFYGGFIGALLATILFLRIRRESFWVWADFMAPVLAFGYALGRIGCFLNGCCFGRECTLPWAIEFSYTGLPTGLRHPTQLYATLWELGVVVVLLLLEWRRNVKPLDNHSDIKADNPKTATTRTGQLFLLWLFLHSIGRLIMEHFRDDFRGENYLELSISSWMSIFIIISVIAISYFRFFQKK
ncbi:MAG: prolipoprotein diacylglyceryl transferase [Bdellovibrionales bacterium]|nr:prolipoprotein diacylglyceryl transferase [Bdellovibrionales bacterium]